MNGARERMTKLPGTPDDLGAERPREPLAEVKETPCSAALVVDDEKNIRTTLALCLENMGFEVAAVGDGEAALEALAQGRFELAFVDLRLGQTSGLDLLPHLLAAQPNLAVVMITAYATFDTAVEAIKRGAVDYLPKPFTPAQVRHVADRIREQRGAARKAAELETLLASEVAAVDLASEAPAMRAALDLIARAAPHDAPVLLRGENGTGKGVLARALHAQSGRSRGPLVTVNCPTLAEELLASELFGHARGSFTGAVADQAGRVEAADGGMLFLDEIGELSPSLQAKLLRFVQDKAFERIGETRTRHADVRIVAATNRDLEADVRSGRFREDLFFRLNVIEVRVPPLRERREDILRLAHGFLAFFARSMSRAQAELEPNAAAALCAYDWPGNIRELRNVIERAVILWPARILGKEALPERVTASAPRPAQAVDKPRLGGDFTLERIEREHILGVLERAPTMDEAACILGIDVSTLWRKRRRYEGR
jgi:NtrC-family two-component system response regulator AlgB